MQFSLFHESKTPLKAQVLSCFHPELPLRSQVPLSRWLLRVPYPQRLLLTKREKKVKDSWKWKYGKRCTCDRKRPIFITWIGNLRQREILTWNQKQPRGRKATSGDIEGQLSWGEPCGVRNARMMVCACVRVCVLILASAKLSLFFSWARRKGFSAWKGPTSPTCHLAVGLSHAVSPSFPLPAGGFCHQESDYPWLHDRFPFICGTTESRAAEGVSNPLQQKIKGQTP